MRFVAARSIAGFLLSILMSACAGGATDDADAPEWSLSAEPTLTIGEDGTVEGELVRVVTALPLPGDEVAVVDAGHSEIRVFDGTGRYRRTIGRKGEGPGEFANISWVQVSHDTLLIYDMNQRRLTLLRADGTVHATTLARPEGEATFATPVARAAGGTWVVRNSFTGARLVGQNAPPPTGVLRDTVGIGLLDATGTGPVAYFHRAAGRRLIGLPTGTYVSRFSRSAPQSVHTVGGRIAVVDSELARISWFTGDGQAQASAPLAIPRRPVVASTLDSLRGAAMEGITSPPEREAIGAMHDPQAAPTHLPVFQAVLPDGDAMLWLEEWQYAPPNSARYLVVNGEGKWVATVTMPPGFKAATIGPDWVLGVHSDTDGVQRVMRYGLVRQ